MSTHTAFPFALHWSAQDLADAVPRRLRLHELFAVDTPQTSAGNDPCFRAPRVRGWHAGYAAPAPLPAYFRIR